MLARRTFNVVVVGKHHGVGGEETQSPEKVVTYAGRKIVVKF
jgi:hypothetical protein